MGGRKIHFKKPAPSLEEKKKPMAMEQQEAIVFGQAYSLEQIQELLSSLISPVLEDRVSAVSEFAKNAGAVAEAASGTPEVNGTDIMELVISAVVRNEQEMLNSFQQNKDITTLTFIAQSSAMPEKVQKHAAQILKKIEPRSRLKKAEKEPSYSEHQVDAILQSLKSPDSETRMTAAIRFFHDYPLVVPAVMKMPMLTVTEVGSKALEVLEQKPEKAISEMTAKNMHAALSLLSSMDGASPELRHAAKKALRSFEEKKEMPAPVQPLFAPADVTMLINNLDSGSLSEAIKFIKNYDAYAEAISKVPMLTVTEVSKKAVAVIENDLDAALTELRKTKDRATARFVSESGKFSDKTRKKAAELLQELLSTFKEP